MSLATIFGFLIPVLVIGMWVMAIAGMRRLSSGRPAVDAGTFRRFFQYGLLYAVLILAAVGTTEVLTWLFQGRPDDWYVTGGGVARSLAFVLVGAPAAATIALVTRRGRRRDPAENDSHLYAIYLTITPLTAMLLATWSLSGLLARLLGPGRDFDAGDAVGFVVWGAVWLTHWIVARRSLGERNAPHLFLGSFVGLVVASVGLYRTIGASLDVIVRQDAFITTTYPLAAAVGTLVAGVLVWVRYWLTAANPLRTGNLRLMYVLVFGVGGGLVLWLVAASRILWTVLVWFIGDPASRYAPQFFGDTTYDVGMLVVGALLWWYHRALLEDDMARSEVPRIYEYLVSGIALTAAATGVGTVLVAFIESITPGIDIGLTTMNTLLAAVTLLLVGVPVWWVFWKRIRRAVEGDAPTEVSSLTRRIYLVVLFGVVGVVAVGALVLVAYTFLQDAVNGQVGLATLRSMRYGLGTLVAAAAVSAYHWSVFRQDRSVAKPEAPRGPRSVVLVGAPADELAQDIARATGARVESWTRLDGAGGWDQDSVLTAIEGHEGHDLLVLSGPDGPGVIVVAR